MECVYEILSIVQNKNKAGTNRKICIEKGKKMNSFIFYIYKYTRKNKYVHIIGSKKLISNLVLQISLKKHK